MNITNIDKKQFIFVPDRIAEQAKRMGMRVVKPEGMNCFMIQLGNKLEIDAHTIANKLNKVNSKGSNEINDWFKKLKIKLNQC